MEKLGPKIFADTSKISEIERLQELGLIHGITTNSGIVAKEAGGAEPFTYYRELAKRFPELPLSIQLTSKNIEDLRDEAKRYVDISPRVVVKVPMYTDGRGLTLIRDLSEAGIPINVTALMSKEQVLLALMATEGRFISPLPLPFPWQTTTMQHNSSTMPSCKSLRGSQAGTLPSLPKEHGKMLLTLSV